MEPVAKAESRRLQVERFVTLFPGRNSRAGVGTGSHCALSHCQGHRKKSACSIRQALLSRTPECRDEEDPSGSAMAWGSEQERSMGLGGRTSESGEAGCVG